MKTIKYLEIGIEFCKQEIEKEKQKNKPLEDVILIYTIRKRAFEEILNGILKGHFE